MEAWHSTNRAMWKFYRCQGLCWQNLKSGSKSSSNTEFIFTPLTILKVYDFIYLHVTTFQTYRLISFSCYMYLTLFQEFQQIQSLNLFCFVIFDTNQNWDMSYYQSCILTKNPIIEFENIAWRQNSFNDLQAINHDNLKLSAWPWFSYLRILWIDFTLHKTTQYEVTTSSIVW